MIRKKQPHPVHIIHVFGKGDFALCGARLRDDLADSRMDADRANCPKCLAMLPKWTEEEEH
ncbi:MAG: hypothetical protein ABS95_02245 [Verrucomicrobia bacterium SCN 57-15]|nr:MAG: hypothetical protein ABS95_02245 [Verrucomicrobia bacterium SCN 57-15]